MVQEDGKQTEKAESAKKEIANAEETSAEEKTGARARTLDDEFIRNQFKMQREITNAVLKKFKATENLVSLVRDQQTQILSLVKMFA